MWLLTMSGKGCRVDRRWAHCQPPRRDAVNRQGITIITDSIAVFNILNRNEQNILILTGGAYRHSSQMLVGPTAEGSLRELRGDKLFFDGLWDLARL